MLIPGASMPGASAFPQDCSTKPGLIFWSPASSGCLVVCHSNLLLARCMLSMPGSEPAALCTCIYTGFGAFAVHRSRHCRWHLLNFTKSCVWTAVLPLCAAVPCRPLKIGPFGAKCCGSPLTTPILHWHSRRLQHWHSDGAPGATEQHQQHQLSFS